MKKQFPFLKTAGPIIILLVMIGSAKGQNTCATATVFDSINIDSTILYNNAGPVYWIKFTANYANYKFELSQPVQTPFSGMTIFQLYKGTCLNKVLINLDSNNFKVFNLELNQDYYLVVNKVDTGNSYFNLKISIDTNNYTTGKIWDETNCPDLLCDFINNGDFTLTWDFDPQILDPFGNIPSYGTVSCWLQMTPHPNIDFTYQYAPSAKMWTAFLGYQYVWGESIRQDLTAPLTPNIIYQFRFDWRSLLNTNSSTDELCIYLVDPDAVTDIPNYYSPYLSKPLPPLPGTNPGLKNDCDLAVQNNNGIRIGQNSLINLYDINNWRTEIINFSVDNPNFTRLIIFPYEENIFNTQSMTSIIIDNVSISKIGITGNVSHDCFNNAGGIIDISVYDAIPNTTLNYTWSNGAHTQDISNLEAGTYAVTVTNSAGCSNVALFNVYPGPQKPDLGDYNTTVCEPDETDYYHISNPEQNVEYTWTVDPSGAGDVNGAGTDVSITWYTFTEANIVIHCYNPVTGCSMDYSYQVFAPCGPDDPSYYYLCNETSSAANSYPFQDYAVITGETFVINGYFIIDNEDLHFQNCQFIMGPYAKIILAEDKVVEITDDCSFYIDADCKYMWDGFYVEYPKSFLYMENSMARDAINGFVSRNGGQINFVNNTLQDNYYSLQVKDYSGVSGNINVKVERSTFYGNPSLPYLPHQGEHDIAGISVKNVGDPNTSDGIVIGDYNDSQNRNFFHDQSIGILAEESNIYIYNNEIDYTVGTNYDGYPAIKLIGDCDLPIMPYPIYNAVIGGNNENYPNYINHYSFGIGSSQSYNLTIEGNTIENCDQSITYQYSGLNAPAQTFTYVNINHNIINDGNACGILANYNSSCTSDIFCNTINMVPLAEGIYLVGSAPDNYSETYNVVDNQILSGSGISAFHLSQVGATSNDITLHNNPSSIWPKYGLHFFNCDYIYASDNTVVGTGSPILNNNKYGISTEQNGHPMYKCNHISNAERGLNIVASNYNPNYLVSIGQNVFNNCDYGMVKSNYGRIGTQGNSVTPWLNQWLNITLQNRVIGIGGNYQDICRARDGSIYQNEDFLTVPTAFVKDIVTCGACTIPACWGMVCNELFSQMNLEVPELDAANNNLPNVVNSGNPTYILQNNTIANTDNLPDINWFMSKQIAYMQMMDDKSVYMQDAGFNSFIHQCDNNSIGELYLADQYAGMGKADSAEVFNNMVVVTNIADSLHKFVNGCNISFLRNRKLEFDTLTMLRDIANLCPFTFGDGVYRSRALLFSADTIRFDYLNICEVSKITNKNSEAADKEENENMQISLYPNPAKEQITIECTALENSDPTIQFKLYDLMGKEILSTTIIVGQITEINTSELKQGVYYYKFVSGNRILEKDKLVIIR